MFRFPLPPQPGPPSGASGTAAVEASPQHTRVESAAPDNGTTPALTRVTYKKGSVAPKTTALAPEIKHYVKRGRRRPIGAHLAVTCTRSCPATYHKPCSRQHWCSGVVSRISRCRSLFCVFGKKLASECSRNKRLSCVTVAGLRDTRMTSP